MDIDLIFKIAAVGILVAVLNILLQRSGRDEQALMTTITALVVVLMIVVQKISELFNMIKVLFNLIDMEIVAKCAGTALLSTVVCILIKRINPELSFAGSGRLPSRSCCSARWD